MSDPPPHASKGSGVAEIPKKNVDHSFDWIPLSGIHSAALLGCPQGIHNGSGVGPRQGRSLDPGGQDGRPIRTPTVARAVACAAVFHLMADIPDSVLDQLEADKTEGITSAAMLDLLAEHGVRFSEATLRKWVQIGLLPRSVRVGRKGKHQGSQGLYPVRAVRQILRIKAMMRRDLTIEEIQQRFLFVRGDIEQLEETLGVIFRTLDRVLSQRPVAFGAQHVGAEIDTARQRATDLVARLEQIEGRLTARAANVDRALGRAEVVA